MEGTEERTPPMTLFLERARDESIRVGARTRMRRGIGEDEVGKEQ